MNETIELDLKEIGTALLKQIWAIILCAVIAGLGMLVYTANFVTPTYKADVTMYVNNSSGGVSQIPSEEHSDGFADIEGIFDCVITNPPIRAGKQVIYGMFRDCAGKLRENGALYIVIRKQQGAESCVKYLKTLFNIVEKLDKSAGFWVLKAYEPKNDTEGDTDEV